MRYLSVCSGIEAATVAWHPLGWEPVAFSEIEQFPCNVLAHHYPKVPNLGDMTKFKEWPDYANVDVLVGGTPCQSFSIAGLRKGLDDPRGNLMLTYLAIAARYMPKWIVWENVPGVLSSSSGRDFGTFLGGLAECGYGFAYRILDAQYCRTDGYPYAVPQRRRRVFVIGCLGDWRSAAAVLFDSESLCGNPPPSRKAREEVAGTVAQGTFECGGIGSNSKSDNSSPLMKSGADLGNGCEALITHAIALTGNTIGREPENGGNGTGFDESGASYTLTKTDVHAVAFDTAQITSKTNRSIPQTICHTLHKMNTHHCINNMQVRRLTPIECARLMGFPDDFLSQVKGYSDSAAYKSLGNSMACNVMAVIGQKIQQASQLSQN